MAFNLVHLLTTTRTAFTRLSFTALYVSWCFNPVQRNKSPMCDGIHHKPPEISIKAWILRHPYHCRSSLLRCGYLSVLPGFFCFQAKVMTPPSSASRRRHAQKHSKCTISFCRLQQAAVMVSSLDFADVVPNGAQSAPTSSLWSLVARGTGPGVCTGVGAFSHHVISKTPCIKPVVHTPF